MCATIGLIQIICTEFDYKVILVHVFIIFVSLGTYLLTRYKKDEFALASSFLILVLYQILI
jgi:hypothetical protein